MQNTEQTVEEQVNTEKKGQSSSMRPKVLNFFRKNNQQPKSSNENKNTGVDRKQTGNGVTFMPISEESIYNLENDPDHYSKGINLNDPYANVKEDQNSQYYRKNTDTIL